MAAGGWLNGSSNQTLVLAGSLTGEADANLGVTAAGDPTLTAILRGISPVLRERCIPAVGMPSFPLAMAVRRPR